VKVYSDHLQLIILAVLRPWEGGLQRGEIFGSALLQPARSVFIPLIAFSFIYLLLAGCCTRCLNQALYVLSLSLDFLNVCCTVN